MQRLLIIEDEVHIVTPIVKGLTQQGFTMAVAQTGREALAIARDPDFDLVILDLGLPDLDGWVVLKELRARGERMPIIILSARDEIRDKVAGLEGGANDYVTKPFSFQELLARIRLRLKESSPSSIDEVEILKVGKIGLNLHTHQATIGDRTIELSAREFVLLETLMRNCDRTIEREYLLKEVWGYDYDPGTNIVDVYIGYLRKKLGTYSIETIRSVGYRLNATDR